MSGSFSFDKLGARAVEGGREDDGTPLAIARARAKEHSGFMGIGGGGHEGLFPGKANPNYGAFVTVGDKEIKVDVSINTFSLFFSSFISYSIAGEVMFAASYFNFTSDHSLRAHG